MMNLWEVLKASKTGLAPDFYTRLLSDKLILAGKIAELADVPPLYFKSDGEPLIDYTIYGNAAQNGTPTPDSPIMPQGTGDLETVGTKAGQYKIPISSANTTTPVYLGEVQTTRKIRKLVFDGVNDGEWKKSSARPGSFYLNVGTNAIVGLGLCDRAVNVDTIEQYNSIGKMYIESSGSKIINLWLFNTNMSLDDFKTYLQQQYANGTPVTVWYVLATPETGIVNEPLMKIGDYADSLTAIQSGVEIPTIRGDNVLDVNTAVKPSKVRIKYHAP